MEINHNKAMIDLPVKKNDSIHTGLTKKRRDEKRNGIT
jgi:hypothetical protein